MAPVKWRDELRRIKEKYAHNMKTRWPVLCYCDNNWKAHEIATNNYLQWYKNYSRKKLVNKSDEQPQKRRRLKIEDEENAPSKSESETEDMGMDKTKDRNDSTSSSVPHNDDESRRGTSKPCAYSGSKNRPNVWPFWKD
jgi:hypothetical protein